MVVDLASIVWWWTWPQQYGGGLGLNSTVVDLASTVQWWTWPQQYSGALGLNSMVVDLASTVWWWTWPQQYGGGLGLNSMVVDLASTVWWWTWPQQYSGALGLNSNGEHKYVALLGGLHFEMSILRVIGDWLEGSGLLSLMATANLSLEGRAEAISKGSHISRRHWAHQVTTAALFLL